MAHVIALSALGGVDFTIQPQQLLECTEIEATRLVELGMARELLKSEPTEVQLATLARLPGWNSESPDVQSPDQANQQSPTAPTTAKAKASRSRKTATKTVDPPPAAGPIASSDADSRALDSSATSGNAASESGSHADVLLDETKSFDTETTEQS